MNVRELSEKRSNQAGFSARIVTKPPEIDKISCIFPDDQGICAQRMVRGRLHHPPASPRFLGSLQKNQKYAPCRRLLFDLRASAAAIASYVGVAPRLRQSGKKRFSGSPTIPFGNARLRKALWMVVLNAVRCNPWLRQYYERLRAAGKPGKVAVIAAMRKLLAAVWSVATHRRPFVPIMPAVPVTKNA